MARAAVRCARSHVPAAGVAGRAFARAVRGTLPCPLLLGMLLLAVATGSPAREPPPLFEGDDALVITLEARWAQVLRKERAPAPHAAVLGYTDPQGRAHRIAATVETRGVTRLRVCRFPPLRVRLAPAATRGTVLEGQRSLKLVTHCQPGPLYERYYARELLAYRIYHLVSQASFRVRPLEVTYLETGGGKPNGPRFAFLVEDLRDVARRGGHAVSREASFAPADYDPRVLTRFMLYQYLLGNTDWDVTAGPRPGECCHNVRVVGSEDPRTRIPVPYDFDSAGLVNASYAAPHERLPITSVTQRLYRGFCVHNAALEPVRREFLEHRPAIMALVQGQPSLGPQDRRAAIDYIDAFYAVLGDDTRFAREITAKCRR